MDTLVFESIEALESELKEIDVDRIYVTGVSRGGYGSWHFISLRPDMFAAAMPVCGGGDPNVPPNIVDVDVWPSHGEDDPNVPVSGSRNIIAAIKKSGGNPKYTEFEGAGHDTWDYVTKTPGVLVGCLSRSVKNRFPCVFFHPLNKPSPEPHPQRFALRRTSPVPPCVVSLIQGEGTLHDSSHGLAIS